MNYTRSILTAVFILTRIGERFIQDDIFPTHLLQQGSTIDVSYGQLVFYETFVTSYSTPDRKRNTLYRCCNTKHPLPMLLLLCGDVHPCPGLTDQGSRSSLSSDQSCASIDSQYKVFRSLIPKLDEIRLLANRTRAACVCLTETWLDDTVSDSEVSIPNYVIRRGTTGIDMVAGCVLIFDKT